MGIIRSKPQVEYYTDTFHITDTFSNHVEWKHTVKKMNHTHGYPFFYEQVNKSDVFGSQPYVVYAIYDKETKEEIQKMTYGQPHISVCNCLFVFCARTDFNLDTNISFPDLPQPSFFQRYIYGLWSSHEQTRITWASRQTYMALGFVIAACSEESIPCSPIDGFDIPSISSILELPSHLIPTALLAIGAED